jgi:hypothetical protein
MWYILLFKEVDQDMGCQEGILLRFGENELIEAHLRLAQSLTRSIAAKITTPPALL